MVRLTLLSAAKLLVIDHNPDSGALLVRTLARKLSQHAVQLCEDSDGALRLIRSEAFDAIVLHRTLQQSAVELVKDIRQLNAAVPIIVVSGVDRSEEVLAAGATGFMRYDEWLNVGNVVMNALQFSKNPFSGQSADGTVRP